jgi:hypothetical protein
MDKEKIDTKILVINSLIKKKNINKLNVLGWKSLLFGKRDCGKN